MYTSVFSVCPNNVIQQTKNASLLPQTHYDGEYIELFGFVLFGYWFVPVYMYYESYTYTSILGTFILRRCVFPVKNSSKQSSLEHMHLPTYKSHGVLKMAQITDVADCRVWSEFREECKNDNFVGSVLLSDSGSFIA